jgi:hypothetical protein
MATMTDTELIATKVPGGGAMTEEQRRRRNERIMLADEDLARARAMLQAGYVLSAARRLEAALVALRDIARLDAQEAQCGPR